MSVCESEDFFFSCDQFADLILQEKGLVVENLTKSREEIVDTLLTLTGIENSRGITPSNPQLGLEWNG